MIVVRLCKIALVASIALFFTFVAFGNITDYDSNWQFVRHVLSMDTTFPDSKLHWRAITDPSIQQAAYWLIIATQIGTAALLWLGTLLLLATVRKDGFAGAGTPAVAGLTVGLLLYIVGFVTIGSEWFAMWQSATWNGQQGLRVHRDDRWSADRSPAAGAVLTLSSGRGPRRCSASEPSRVA